MAVHVAEAADIHENVEAESGPGVEGAERLVVLAAMAQARAMISATRAAGSPATRSRIWR